MAIARIGGQNSSGTSTSYALAQPGTALAAGDFRLVTLWWASTTTTISVPSGWSTAFASTTVNGGKLASYWRFHQAGDASYTFSSSVSAQWVARCTNLSGVHTATPIDITPTTSSQTTSSTTWTNCPAITPATAGAFIQWWLVAGSAGVTSRTFALGSGWTGATADTQNPIGTTAGYIGLGAYESNRAAGISTGSRTATYSTVTNTYRGLAVALRPAPDLARTSRHFHTLAAA